MREFFRHWQTIANYARIVQCTKGVFPRSPSRLQWKYHDEFKWNRLSLLVSRMPVCNQKIADGNQIGSTITQRTRSDISHVHGNTVYPLHEYFAGYAPHGNSTHATVSVHFGTTCPQQVGIHSVAPLSSQGALQSSTLGATSILRLGPDVWAQCSMCAWQSRQTIIMTYYQFHSKNTNATPMRPGNTLLHLKPNPCHLF